MKKILLLATFLVSGFVQISYSQDSTSQQQLSQLLTHYYSIKDALVSGNPGTAALKGEAFLKTANAIDYKIISEGNINALVKDATAISETKDINKQRGYFANLSNNMAALAKVIKFTSQPIYQAYCPMKKANWLSKEKDIKNPYYGNAMLTCGKVVETIQ
ncbi:MAG TPA: DUF3347 domain-containing protein [Flavisolibacter sp.]|nr:DUF3347 domain-containing protein [Flavisolibacter sp.]